MTNETQWEAYYQRLSGRATRHLFNQAVALFPPDVVGRQAIDLGCGDGTETQALIGQGWRVLAIDSEPAALAWLERRIPAEQRGQLQTQLATFAEAQLVEADLIYAGLSLFFCPPQHFNQVWQNIITAIPVGGRFAGHLLGEQDTWAAEPHTTALTRPAVESLFTAFTLELLDEQIFDRPTALGEAHHWHIFEVIARKLPALG